MLGLPPQGNPHDRFLLPAAAASGAGRFVAGQEGKGPMDDHVYKIIELASSSNESIDDAVRKGVARAAQTLENLRWVEVKEMRGHIEDGEVAHYQVVLRIGFTLNDAS